MLNERENLIRAVRAICKDALDGSIGIEKFHRVWPEEADTDPLLGLIYNDVEDGVEHLPAYWLTGNINFKSWKQSRAYLTLYLDYVLLEYKKNVESLIRCREVILTEKNLSQELVQHKIAEFFESSGGR